MGCVGLTGGQGSPTDEDNVMRHNSNKLCNLYATYAKPQNGHDNANYMAMWREG